MLAARTGKLLTGPDSLDGISGDARACRQGAAQQVVNSSGILDARGPIRLRASTDLPITLKMSEETELVYQTIGKLAVHAQTFKVSTTIEGLSDLHASMNIDSELIETALGRTVGRIQVVRDGPIKETFRLSGSCSRTAGGASGSGPSAVALLTKMSR